MSAELERGSIQGISVEELRQLDRISGRLSTFGAGLSLAGFGGILSLAALANEIPDEANAGIAVGSTLLMCYGAWFATRTEFVKDAVLKEASRRGLQIKNKLGVLVAFSSIQDNQINSEAA